MLNPTSHRPLPHRSLKKPIRTPLLRPPHTTHPHSTVEDPKVPLLCRTLRLPRPRHCRLLAQSRQQAFEPVQRDGPDQLYRPDRHPSYM